LGGEKVKTLATQVAGIAHGENVSAELGGIINRAVNRSLQADIAAILPRGRADRNSIVAALKLCESPIEKIMLVGLMTMITKVAVVVHSPMSGEPFPRAGVVVMPQFVLARYRLDFLITVQRPFGPYHFAVECDGIEFHGSLQKRHEDNERDQYLRALGIKTLRYYGQKIKQLGHQCADEIAAIVNEKLEYD
jgi:very-short-patch-repair endonuclease